MYFGTAHACTDVGTLEWIACCCNSMSNNIAVRLLQIDLTKSRGDCIFLIGISKLPKVKQRKQTLLLLLRCCCFVCLNVSTSIPIYCYVTCALLKLQFLKKVHPPPHSPTENYHVVSLLPSSFLCRHPENCSIVVGIYAIIRAQISHRYLYTEP